MRALLTSILCLFGLSSYGQPILRNFATTNTPTVLSNIVQGLGGGISAATATNIAAYQAQISTNGYAPIATNIAAYQAFLATNNYAVIATNIAAYQAEIATNGYAPIATNIAAYQAYLATNTYVAGSLSPGLSNTFVLKSGDTVSGPILTTSTSSNAPAQNELATGGWVRSLFNNGVIDYVTTNIDGVATNLGSPDQFVYKFWQGVIPQPSTRVWVSAFLTNNAYVGSVITTNTFSFLEGPVAINSYLGLSSGGGDALTVHPEIYYSYDKTNWYGDWEAQGQALTPGRTNLYQFIISFPAITATNSSGFYLQRRFKVNSSGGTPTLYVLVGTNNSSGTLDASHISFSGPNSAIGNAYLANNQTFTGSNQFSGGMMVWGDSNKTNGVWIGPAGEVLSNNLGSVTIAGGTVAATARGLFTNGVASAALTVATLPASPLPGQRVWVGDVITTRQIGGDCYYDGSNWRTMEGVIATANRTNFVLNGWASFLRANSPTYSVYSIRDLAASGGDAVHWTTSSSNGDFGTTDHTSLGNFMAMYLDTASSASGHRVLYGIKFVPAASDVYGVAGACYFSSACSSAEMYFALVGFFSTSALATNLGAGSGAFFYYDTWTNNIQTVPTGAGVSWTNNWICAVVKGGTSVIRDSGLPASTSSSTFDKLSVVLTTTSATFLTNGVACYVNGTAGDLPTANLYPMFKITKVVGTTSRKLYAAFPYENLYRASITLP